MSKVFQAYLIIFTIWMMTKTVKVGMNIDICILECIIMIQIRITILDILIRMQIIFISNKGKGKGMWFGKERVSMNPDVRDDRDGKNKITKMIDIRYN